MIRIQELSFAYDSVPTLEGITLEISRGELLALVGPNGSGKSTLLKLISGVLRPKWGAVYLDLQPIDRLSPKEIARRLAALEQERSVGFEFTVRELVEWGRHPHRGRLERWRGCDERAVRRALQLMGLEELEERLVSELSGGERQRVFLTMALAQEPQILLLDEPTAHLDLKYQLEIIELVRALAEEGLTVIVAMHDLNWAARYADRAAVLSKGHLVACGPPAEIFTPELIREVWGVEVEIVSRNDNLLILPRATVEEYPAACRSALRCSHESHDGVG
jgi:iron complex transport system ATP-binding protein